MVRNIVEGVKFVKFNCIMMVYILSTHLSDYFVIHKNQFLILLKPKTMEHTYIIFLCNCM